MYGIHLPARLVPRRVRRRLSLRVSGSDQLPHRSTTMSIPFLPEHLACIRDDARRIVNARATTKTTSTD